LDIEGKFNELTRMTLADDFPTPSAVPHLRSLQFQYKEHY